MLGYKDLRPMKYATLNLLRGWVYIIIHCASQALQSTPSTILHHLHHAKVAVMTPVVNAVSSGVPEEDEEGTEDSPTSRSSTHKVSLLHCFTAGRKFWQTFERPAQSIRTMCANASFRPQFYVFVADRRDVKQRCQLSPNDFY